MPITVDGASYPSLKAWNEAMDARATQNEAANLPSAAGAPGAPLAVSPDILNTPAVPATAGAASPASREGTAQFWMAQGAPAHVAAGIADRVRAESGFNPGIMGDANTSGGLYQHHADRLSRLQQFAAQQGLPWNDPRVQHQFALNEVKGGDPIAAKHWQEILAAPDQRTAAMLWDRYFERSAGGPGSAGGGARMGGRFGGMGPRVAIPGAADPALSDTGQAAPVPASSLSRAMSSPVANLQVQPQQPAAAAAPAAVARHPVAPLQPVPLTPAPNLYKGYQDALAAVLNGQRRGFGSIFG